MAYLVGLLLLPLCTFFHSSLALPSAGRHCKPLPDDPTWPSESEWQALNSSVSGRLRQPIPAGAVCHRDWPQFDNSSCELVKREWSQTIFHYKDPESVDYNDETCRPNPSAPCSARGYPSYVVEASNVQDVQEAVNFAKKTGIRLIVKGTGHDFPGRSSGPDSLSIYVRNLHGIELTESLESSAPTEPAALVKLHAGEIMVDVMRFAAANNLTIIGGADPHVGVGGWFQGGGHGPLTALYGTGADQVVEMEVVTAEGEYLTINEHKDSDLFWAMRGAGGSTYAVILSVTVKAYPSTSVTEYLFAYETTSDSDTFWSMAAYFHSELPRLSRQGFMGYYFVYPLATGVKNSTKAGQVVGSFLGPGLSPVEMKKIIKPVEDRMSDAHWGDPVYAEGYTVEHSDFSSWWAKSDPQAGGFSGRLGSRLLDDKALTSDMNALKVALKKSTPVPWPLLGHLTAGPGTHHPPDGIPGGSNAVGPAWRTSYTHIVIPRQWPALNATAKHLITTELREVWTEALRELAPDTGAYVNEVDPTEPNWKQTLYGEHYPRLLSIKSKWDPEGVFWCTHCVGSDLWKTIGPYGIENGVGQNHVQLCRNS